MVNFSQRRCDYRSGAKGTAAASEGVMGTVIRFPIERRDFGITKLPEGQSAVVIPFPMHTGREITVRSDLVPAAARTK
jgi:hypothetical protein